MIIPRPNKAVVKKLCRDLGIEPQRAAGQNFLIKPKYAEQLVDTAKITGKDAILEIGPGFGWLTALLAEKANLVYAVEIEKRFISWLRDKLPANVELIHNDIFKVNISEKLKTGNYKIVSLIPYGLTNKLIRYFLTNDHRPESISIVIQKEVADRIMADKGGHSKLSLLVQRYSQATLVQYIPKEAFWPMPKVESAIIHLAVDKKMSNHLEKVWWQMVRIGFSSKRKKLSNNLSAGYMIDKKTADNWLKKAKIDAKSRPQELDIQSWDKLLGTIMNDKKISWKLVDGDHVK